MVKAETAFWDTSALVPLCVVQANSVAAESNAGLFARVVWWGTYVEVRSAIARLQRTGHMNRDGAKNAAAMLDRLRLDWGVIPPSDEVSDLACDLLERYPLRAADSLQLAAAMVWCRGKPAGRRFLCADRRLSEAARAAGFSVVEF